MNTQVRTAPKRNGKGIKGARPVAVIYDEIDAFVDNHPNMKIIGWDVEVYRRNPMAWSRPDGVQVDGIWHTRQTVCPDSKSGKWFFDPKDTYVAAQ